MTDQNRKAFIKSYGCQMNVYDAERMGEALNAEGYDLSDSPEDADLVILNTCHIREKASEKVYSELGRLKKQKEAGKEKGKELKIAVAGCVAQAEGKEIIARQPAVDMVFGPQSYHKLPELLKQSNNTKHVVDTEFPVEDKFAALTKRAPKAIKQRGKTAFLTVQEGCDKFCTFCVVPYTRGAEFSRPFEQIMSEAEALANAEVIEMTLLGQNVNAYHGLDKNGKEWGLGDLLFHLAETRPEFKRLRYTTSHPRDMDQRLLDAHRDIPEVMPYLHLPIQSGSNTILKAMNRQHERDDYLRLMDEIRDAQPDIALSGDFIVGFPGETDQDFEDTMDIIRRVTYAQAYSFKYSPRPGTPAADKATQVPEDVKSQRLTELQALLNEQQIQFNRSKIGQEMDVLLERFGKKEGQLVGRSPWLQAVYVDAAPEQMGQMVRVKITTAGANSISGDII